MTVKKKSKSKYLSFVFTFIILLAIAKQSDFFKNFYFITKLSYKERLLKQYNFCGYESLGFLNYLKEKYNFDRKVKIINFGNSPDPSWFYSDLQDSVDNEKIIILSYGRNRERFSSLYNAYDLRKYRVIENIESCYFLKKK
jgi:hypothetical protein